MPAKPEQLSMLPPEPTTALQTHVPQRRRGFAGFSWGQLLGSALVLGAAVWGTWATREILALGDKRIVAVSLTAMANDFVMAEARSGNSPEQTDADTRHYMEALQGVLKERALKGETILVGEAVVSSSVPDVTPEVREAVGKLITANPPPRLPAAAAPPAKSPPAPLAPGPAPAAPLPSQGAFAPNMPVTGGVRPNG